MTVIFHVGRRVPRSWFRRHAGKVKGLITFQENIWQMIKMGLNQAKKRANQSGKINFVLTNSRENEDLNYEIEWIKVIIRGSEIAEEDEYNDCLKIYGPLNKTMKREIPKDDRLKKHFKTKVLSLSKVDEAYKEGYGAAGDSNMSNKLLEMGILTHVEWIKDYESRKEDVKPDF